MMRIKNMAKSFLVGGFIAALSVFSNAQEGGRTLADGFTVAVKTEKTPPDNNRQTDYIKTIETSSGYTINRLIIDEKNKIYFGYDLKVAPEDDKKNKFRISFAPLSINPKNFFKAELYLAQTLPEYPAEVTVEAGETVTFDVLENPQTHAKISDIIKIIRKQNKFAGNFAEREQAKDFTIDDINLRLDEPEISIGGEKTKTGSAASGSIVWVYIEGKGRFIFSFAPQSGFNFQKTGVILDNKILFEYNGEKYQFTNKSPVLGAGGKWNLWILFDGKYQPSDKLSPDSPYQFGAADKVESLFGNK